MKKRIATLLLLSLSLVAMSQAPAFMWVNYPTGSGNPFTAVYATCHDQNNNILSLGIYSNTFGFSGTIDYDPGAGSVPLNGKSIFISKHNSSGQFQWIISLEDLAGGLIFPKNIAVDSLGDIYISGNFNSSIDFDPSATNVILTSISYDDIFVAKYNSSGVYQWAFSIGGNNYDQANNMVVDNQHVYICGSYSTGADFDPSGVVNSPPYPSGCSGSYLAKYTVAGQLIWVKVYSGLATAPGGATFDGLSLDSNKDILLSGLYSGTVDFDPGAGIDTVSCYNSSVNVNGFFGRFSAIDGSVSFLKVIEKDSGGTFFAGIHVDHNDNIYVAGYFGGVIDADPGAGVALHVAPIDPNISAYDTDAFIARYDSQGNYIWSGVITGLKNEYYYNASVDDQNNLVVCGTFGDTADFDPGAGTYLMVAPNFGPTDGFVAKYNTQGALVYAFPISSTVNDVVWSVDAHANGLTIVGMYGPLADFNPGQAQYLPNGITSSQTNYFVAHYYDTITTTGVFSPLSIDQSISIYPVPAKDELHISGPSTGSGCTFIIRNMFGQEVLSGSSSETISLTGIASGVYTIEVYDQSGNLHTGRFVKAE